MKLTVYEMGLSDPSMLNQCLDRVRRFYPEDLDDPYDRVHVEVWCSERQPNGWLEYIMRLPYQNGGGITIGAIQREPGANVEFHS